MHRQQHAAAAAAPIRQHQHRRLAAAAAAAAGKGSEGSSVDLSPEEAAAYEALAAEKSECAVLALHTRTLCSAVFDSVARLTASKDG